MSVVTQGFPSSVSALLGEAADPYNCGEGGPLVSTYLMMTPALITIRTLPSGECPGNLGST